MPSGQPISDILRLDGKDLTVVLVADRYPRLLHFGARLPADQDLSALDWATAPGPRESQPDERIGLTILPQFGSGFMGEPSVLVDRSGAGGADFHLADWSVEGSSLELIFVDALAGLRLELNWRLNAATDMLSSRATIINQGEAAVRLEWLAALSLPLPDWARVAIQVHGRWGGEFQIAETALVTGKLEKVNRTGRSGFDGAHYIILGDPHAGEERGRLIAAHLAWSGNSRSLAEAMPTGERQLQLGEWLMPGEVTLAPGDRHDTPEALVAFSCEGLNGIRSAYHAELRARRAAGRVAQGPRKVHFNSWEAVYFDFDEARLLSLAEGAGALGAERFVLDDGWFRGRRDDSKALGDWHVDLDRLPGGLMPLAKRVASLGMDLGLWVEPEMVSPDSDLYRSKPNWCLHDAGRSRATQRQQLVLDLSLSEVRDHIFGMLDGLLGELPIAYLKWDHNRELFPALSGGRPAGRSQTLGYHALLDRVRAAHPAVEIESCASGGARIDFAVAARTARVWASDNTDAIERLRLQRAMSLFYPLEMMGSHVGAAPNPTTGRSLSLDFRARVAMFAHFGIEADPAGLSAVERGRLVQHVEQYKIWRDLIHGGELRYADGDDPGVTVATISAPDGEQALALVARVDQSGSAVGPLIRLPGLCSGSRYRTTLLEPWPEHAARQLANGDFWRSRPLLDSALLKDVGLRLPVVHPETAWLIHLQRTAR